ncbi:uncharacterized protein BXZ73DRAFT_38492 [Epithele typhae]|uniref:uncharacterized protein n=1 Tax=Epithele typhae TaxID=378194 RepID=UPI002008759B|nr:uncharacterized protein BXZ73DRAFT_38492 [Epithele typhae]KAH9945337.1 hypothetical protein BXZ73DRAFT_38492 [Epithele typhae]
MAHHPPHPQFLDVDWPSNHDMRQQPPLQLENEYDIDPSRYDILQGEVQLPQSHLNRLRQQQLQQQQLQQRQQQQQQQHSFPMNGFGQGQPEQFAGGNDSMFTFANNQAQQQHFSPPYGGGQFFLESEQGSYNMGYGDHSGSMPSSPFFGDNHSPFTFAQAQQLPLGQQQQHPGSTPTMRNFQGDVQRTPMYNVQSPPDFGSSPTHGMAGQGMPYHDQGMGVPHAAKRMRALDDNEGYASSENGDGEGAEEDGPAQQKEGGAKPSKPAGACARCKGLKVKCEFKTDPDICKRCLNGGHDCVIPGRKKRRAPPRRDLLLGQIREQATKIEELMKQLEDANKRAGSKGEHAPTASPPSSTHRSQSSRDLTASDFGGSPEPPGLQVAKPDVLDWIAKARESIEAFGGYINMGGPSVTKDMIGEDVLGWHDSSSDDEAVDFFDDYDESKSDVQVAVQDVDARSGEPQRGRKRPGDPTSDTHSSSNNTHLSRRRNRERLAMLPHDAAPIGMLATLSLRKSRSRKSSRSRSVSTVDEEEYGVANEDYFRASSPGPDRPIMYAQHQTPYILRSGLVSPTEVEKLFKIYFDYVNPSCSILDPVLYTAQKTYWRSPFLFTVILGICSRFYTERPDLYQQAMNCARLAAGSTLIGGQKSVETVVAYILLSLYPVPARKWEEDRCWVYLGLAVRIAQDLNLHYLSTAEPQNEMHAREILNRTRIWMNCFNVDKSISSQYGKNFMVLNTDYLATHSEFFYKSSPYNIPGFDVHLCGYNAELKVLADFRLTIFSDPDHPAGLNKNIDVAAETIKTDNKLEALWYTWSDRIREEGCQELYAKFRTSLLKLAIYYARMAVLSFSFAHLYGREGSQKPDEPFFWRCFNACKDLLNTLLHELGVPELRPFLRHGPDAECVFVTFACAFLIKLLHPRYIDLIPHETRVEMREMVTEVAHFLGSPEIAVDDRHGPKLYSRFLEGLLEMPSAQICGSGTNDGGEQLPSSNQLLSPPVDGNFETGSDYGVDGVPPVEVQPPSPQPGSQMNVALPPESQAFDDMQFGEPAVNPALFSPPLPFDTELVQSMQSITSQPWSLVMPGFSWMDIMQDPDVSMRFAGSGSSGQNLSPNS